MPAQRGVEPEPFAELAALAGAAHRAGYRSEMAIDEAGADGRGTKEPAPAATVPIGPRFIPAPAPRSARWALAFVGFAGSFALFALWVSVYAWGPDLLRMVP